MANISTDPLPSVIRNLILGFLFVGLALLQLGLARGELEPLSFLPLGVWTVCAGLAAYLVPSREPILLPLLYFLSGLGLALVARLAPAFAGRQMIWLVIATGLLLAVNLVPRNLNWLRRYKYSWLFGGLLLLAATLLFGVSPSGFGPRLWLQLGDIYFQPSEPLKLLLVVFLAAYLSDRHRQLVEAPAYLGRLPLPHPSYFGPMVVMWGFSIILLVWQRDLGAALLFFGTFSAMLYAATGQSRYIWVGAGLLLMAGGLGYHLFGVVQLRVEAFLNPWLDPSGRSFQVVQSLLAFASGGFFGQGLGQGLPTAIPVVHTDFVFAAIGEEYGLLGAVAVLACFAVLVSRAFHIALVAASNFEKLLAAGIGAMLGLQVIVITAGTLKLLPLTGVTLPFVSYGGSSLLTSFVMVALLIFIANRRTDERRPYHPLPSPPILRLVQALLFGFLIVAGGLFLWQIVAAPILVDRADNPRPIVAEQKIRRGKLLTATGLPIAETIIEENGLVRRHYPYPRLSSVTGYYSLRYGVDGAEAAFDPILRGVAGRTERAIWLDELLHRPLVGQDVPLTVILPAQVAADVALGDREGAVVVIEIETGAIRVMSSYPTYDPNRLEEQWDSLRQDERAPLINRATQGLFPVGDLARLIGLIGLHEAGADLPADPWIAPLDGMLAPLGRTGYLATAHQLGLSRPLGRLPSQISRLPDFAAEESWPDLAAPPLHLARIIAALELQGDLPDPNLSPLEKQGRTPAISPATARYVRGTLPPFEGRIVGLAGLAGPEETGRGWLSWFIGLAPAQAIPPLAGPEMLPFDPTQAPAAPLPAQPVAWEQARYALVVVAHTAEADETLALDIARATLAALPE